MRICKIENLFYLIEQVSKDYHNEIMNFLSILLATDMKPINIQTQISAWQSDNHYDSRAHADHDVRPEGQRNRAQRAEVRQRGQTGGGHSRQCCSLLQSQIWQEV